MSDHAGAHPPGGEVLLAAAAFTALALAPLALVFFDLRGHDGQRMVQLALLVIAAVLVAARSIAQPAPPLAIGRAAAAAVAALVLLGALSVLHAPVARAAVLEAGLWLALAVFAYATAQLARAPGAGGVLAIAVAASGLFAFTVAVRYGAALASGSAVLREHLLPGYSNYRFFNHVQTVTIPLLVAAALAGPRRAGLRRWAAAALCAEFCLLYFTGGRATMAALTVAAAVVAVAFGRGAVRWLLALAGAAAAGAVLYAVLFVGVPRLLGLPRDFFAADFVVRSGDGVGGPREYLWGLAWRYMVESPWLGIGPMHYAHRANIEAAHPHNVYLQLAAEWGLPFAALAVALAAAGWLRLVRAARARRGFEERALGASLVAAGAAIAVDGLFSGNFVMPMSQLWIALAVGLSVAYVQAGGPPAAPARHRALAVAPCAAAVLMIAQGVWPEIADVNAHVDRVRAQIVQNAVDNPRIWSHGWFR